MKSFIRKSLIAVGAYALAIAGLCGILGQDHVYCPADAQPSSTGGFSPPPPPRVFVPPPPPPPPPPIVQPPPPPPPPPLFIPPSPPNNPFNPPIPVQLDVTPIGVLQPGRTPTPPAPDTLLPGGPDPTGGVTELKSFVRPEDLHGPADFILVRGDVVCYQRETPYLVKLLHGTVLVSVKRPSIEGMMTMPLGAMSFSANSDAFVSWNSGVLRVRNVDGLGTTIRVHVDHGPFEGANQHTFAVAPGYELVLGDHKLSRTDLRPPDGILRRKSAVIADGFGGVSQFQVENALNSSAIIAQMAQKESDAKTKRVLSDMSRMAAVLNHINGYDGYAQ